MTIYRDDLERVYALIEKPEHWTQKAYARDAGGEFITGPSGDGFPDDENAPLSYEAACWCLYGAAIKCGINEWALGMERALGTDVVEFNDTHTHAEVLALLKSAIERAPVRP